MSELFEDLTWRGLVHQVTDAETLPKLLDRDSLVAYIGFDPSADSLHLGHLQQMCLLRRLQQAGHAPIALLGGGTGMIGDPGGKTDERVLLTPDELETNKAGVKAQLEHFLDFGSGSGPAGSPRPGQAILEDNTSWLREARLLDFLRDIGKMFSVNEMVRKDSVRLRLEGREQGISYTEFSYMLLQAWDFLQLYDRYGCRLQLGGSDQWGNIIEGVDLVRRRREVQAFGFTSPLITKADGTKFGKTESGTVWLDPKRTSPYQFFQFWIGTSDAEVGGYLRRLSFQSRPAIEALDEATAHQPERRQAQRALARDLTAMVHGESEAARAERAAEVLFTEEVATLDQETLANVLADAPSSSVSPEELDRGLLLTDALVRTGLASSKSDARRQLEGGGVYLNNRRQFADRPMGRDDVMGRFVILRRGKTRQHVLTVRG
ncbi:MAG: tyrosine--tRNA ligase [Actinomycetota bacterium]|nr:tyrosine--tRNA ligase [Actinomycetota bacterium]MDQ6946730.1 tyrosine--tRNA ligase [Actinomycetota bacterium]